MVQSNEIISQSFIGLQLVPAVAEPLLNAPPTFGDRALAVGGALIADRDIGHLGHLSQLSDLSKSERMTL
jgi:hypothetical protein